MKKVSASIWTTWFATSQRDVPALHFITKRTIDTVFSHSEVREDGRSKDLILFPRGLCFGGVLVVVRRPFMVPEMSNRQIKLEEASAMSEW